MRALLKLTLLLLTAFASGRCPAAEVAATGAPSPEALKTWAQQLGDDDFQKREEAQKRLAEAGQAAAPFLREALKNDDPEVRARAEKLLVPLARDDRLLDAARVLGSTEWEKVSNAIDVLLEHCDQRTENAVAQVAEGDERTAAMAKVLKEQVKEVRKCDDELALRLEQSKRNPAVRKVIEQRMGEVQRTYRQRAYEACLKEFERLKKGASEQPKPDVKKSE